MSSRLRPPPVPTPEVACRCCGKPLDAAWQPGFAERPGYFILTCRVRSCALYNYTFGEDNYRVISLAPYYATALKQEEGPLGQVR